MDLHSLLGQNADIILALDGKLIECNIPVYMRNTHRLNPHTFVLSGVVRQRGQSEPLELERELTVQAINNLVAVGMRMAPKVGPFSPLLPPGKKSPRILGSLLRDGESAGDAGVSRPTRGDEGPQGLQRKDYHPEG